MKSINEKKIGHKFFSETDTEVILKSFREWGEKLWGVEDATSVIDNWRF